MPSRSIAIILPRRRFACFRLDEGHIASVALWSGASQPPPACACSAAAPAAAPPWHDMPLGQVPARLAADSAAAYATRGRALITLIDMFEAETLLAA